MQIQLSNVIVDNCQQLIVSAISCHVVNTSYDAELWNEINALEKEIQDTCSIESINKFSPIFATRQAYKKLGKDPNRYRPSAEALRRRVVRGLPLYQINTLVDVINLISLKSGYSIGGFDADKIQENLELGVGREGELYEGIGRGILNIEGLPVYRDSIGGIGTPTSDEERTKIDMQTTRLLMLINAYSGLENLTETTKYAIDLLKHYCNAKEIENRLITRK